MTTAQEPGAFAAEAAAAAALLQFHKGSNNQPSAAASAVSTSPPRTVAVPSASPSLSRKSQAHLASDPSAVSVQPSAIAGHSATSVDHSVTPSSFVLRQPTHTTVTTISHGDRLVMSGRQAKRKRSQKRKADKLHTAAAAAAATETATARTNSSTKKQVQSQHPPSVNGPNLVLPPSPSGSFFNKLAESLPRDWDCGVRCVEMTDSTPLLTAKDSAELWYRLNNDGYLLLRGVISKDEVNKAKQTVIDKLRSLGALADKNTNQRTNQRSEGSWIADQAVYQAKYNSRTDAAPPLPPASQSAVAPTSNAVAQSAAARSATITAATDDEGTADHCQSDDPPPKRVRRNGRAPGMSSNSSTTANQPEADPVASLIPSRQHQLASGQSALRRRCQPVPLLNASGASSASSASEVSASKSKTVQLSGWLVDLRPDVGVILPPHEKDQWWADVLDQEHIQALPCRPELQQAYKCIFNTSWLNWIALPPNEGTSWLRAKANNEATQPHSDYGYFRTYRNLLSRYYTQRPLTELQTNEQSMHSVLDLSFGQRSLRCLASCSKRDPPSAASAEPRVICSLCRVGYHTDCLSATGTVGPTSAEIAAQTARTGEWHCPTCSEANVDMWTCWMPMSEIPDDPNYSRLMVLPKSHWQCRGYSSLPPTSAAHGKSRKSETSTNLKEPLLPRDWTGVKRTTQSIWHVPSRLQPGDIILFNIKLIHAANPNKSKQFRISLDTRIIATALPLDMIDSPARCNIY